MDKKIKILIVGVGSIGKRHYQNLLGLGFKNVMLADVSSLALKGVSKGSNVKTFKDFKKAISSEHPSIVFVCTPPSNHIQVAQYAAHYNCSIFIEKPLSHNLKSIRNLKTSQDQTVMVAANWQFREAYLELERAIQSARLGKVLQATVVVSYFLPKARERTYYKKIYASRKSGGGVTLDTGSHVIGYLVRLLGNIKKIDVLRSKIHIVNIEAEEAAFALCEFEEKVVAHILMDFFSPLPRHEIKVGFENGQLNVDMINNIIYLENSVGISRIFAGPTDINKMFVDELKYFINCVFEGKKPMYGLKEAVRDLNFLLRKK